MCMQSNSDIASALVLQAMDRVGKVGDALIDVPIDTVAAARQAAKDGEIRLGFEATEKMLNVVVKSAVHTEIRADPWAPRCVEDVFDAAWESLWPEIMAALRDDYMLTHGSASHDGWLGAEMKKAQHLFTPLCTPL